mmetsp:Transcript_8383/g.24646  ORF Transcript_8383/g.24646 Transcript_8383/m.24646 type:complete len:281 (-) Transcript_8383:73-915(-)
MLSKASLSWAMPFCTSRSRCVPRSFASTGATTLGTQLKGWPGISTGAGAPPLGVPSPAALRGLSRASPPPTPPSTPASCSGARGCVAEKWGAPGRAARADGSTGGGAPPSPGPRAVGGLYMRAVPSRLSEEEEDAPSAHGMGGCVTPCGVPGCSGPCPLHAPSPPPPPPNLPSAGPTATLSGEADGATAPPFSAPAPSLPTAPECTHWWRLLPGGPAGEPVEVLLPTPPFPPGPEACAAAADDVLLALPPPTRGPVPKSHASSSPWSRPPGPPPAPRAPS